MTQPSTKPPSSFPWSIRHIAETGSTNADLAREAANGAPHGTVLVTEVQHAGRGRLGRTWVAPAGDALLFSVLLRPDQVPLQSRGWIGGILGLAAVLALEDHVEAQLKWPNDVLVDGHKVAGILAELAGDALVVGMGLNVTVPREALPRPDATSLLLAGVPREFCDREKLLADILNRLAPLVQRWQDNGGDVDASGIRAQYLEHLATLGTEVAVHLPDGSRQLGRAVDVDADGAIVVDSGGRRHRYVAGDVVHLRPQAVSGPESH